jgi:GntR family transcriptional repressor for pyruvate dehydrogenase complex
MLSGVSSRTTRGRVWRGVLEAGATDRTIAEHAAILAALRAHDPQLAEAAALLHVSTTEQWFASLVNAREVPDPVQFGQREDAATTAESSSQDR